MMQDDFSSVDVSTLANNRQWQAQYRTLMSWGDLIQPKPELRLDEHRVRGCAANAWLALQENQFFFDSDSRIIKGLAALLLAQLGNGSLRVENLAAWERQLQQLGLHKHLSPSRNNGLQALQRRMRELWDQAGAKPVAQK